MANELTIYRGNDYTYTLNFKDADGAAINITGYTLFMTVKEKYSNQDTNALISKTITSLTDPKNGIGKIPLSNDDTKIPPGEYVYDFQFKNASDEIKTIVTSTFKVMDKATTRTL